MKSGDRVALRSDRSWTGRVSESVEDGVVRVDGDDGWTGRRLPVEAVEVIPEDKSWPPAGMERK